jgi:release factor glutamine methyltransferase
LRNADVYAVDLSTDALEIARANAARLQLDGRVHFLQRNILKPVDAEERDDARGAAQLSPNESSSVSSREKVRRPQANSSADADDLRDFDFVVSNPPYVGFDEADKVQKSVRDFEPRMAVFAGEQGLDVLAPLVEQAHAALKPGGWLAVEMGYSMRDAVVNLLTPTMWDDVRVVPDLQGIPRVVAGRKKSPATS